jgi:hypothetical protein
MIGAMQLLRTVTDELAAAPNVRVGRSDIVEGLGAGYVADVLGDNGLTACDAYLEFYGSVDLACIEWVAAKGAVPRHGDSMSASGRIGIDAFDTMLQAARSPDSWFGIAWRAYHDARDPTEPRRLIPFDYFEPDSSGCACLEVVDARIVDELHYFDHRHGTYPLELTLLEYCQELTRTKGIFGWQRALLGEETQSAQRVRAGLRRLFPKRSGP